MSKQTEALKLALEALEEINKLSIGENAICLPAEIDTAMDAIREALAEQPAQQDNLHPEYCKGYAAGLEAGAISEKKSAQQQEPVAWRVRWPRMGGGYNWIMNDAPLMAEHGFVNEPLYTFPPASKPWVGLTDEEIEQVCVPLGAAMLSFTEVARAIEAKLREKNT